MGKENNKHVSTRFALALTTVIGLGRFKNKQAAAEYLDCLPQNLSAILKGKLNVQLYMLEKFIKEFPEWSPYIMEGKPLPQHSEMRNYLSEKATSAVVAPVDGREEPTVNRKDYSFTSPELSKALRDIEARLKALENRP